ncbi:TspO/MBR family protein [Methylobacterium sp. A54F]
MPVLVAALVAVATGFAGGLLTVTGPWYHGLRQPAWKPPDWAFGPVWATILACAVASAAMAWGAADAGARGLLVAAYAVNVVLNVAWSGLFFRARRPDWALAEVVLLWLSVLALVVVTAPASTAAALLLLPYLAWVGVAAVLNLRIVRLNRPFGRA